MRRRGFSLIEMLIVVTLVGILAAIVVSRTSQPTDAAKENSCAVNRGNIEIQAQLWLRNNGSWPAADLSDIGADTDYFPDGLPTCPVDGSAYVFDSATQRVTGHNH
jgi:general secretion pathway protein G